MIVSIVRHAWAEDRDDRKYPDDSLRPLTAEGRKRFKTVVEHLGRTGWQPQRVATSPYVRCRQTAELLAAHLPSAPQISVCEALQPGTDLEEMLDWTRRQRGVDHVAWVGHAPDVSEITASLVGEGRAWIRFAKGAVAMVQFPGSIRPGQGELHWLVTAKVLGC